ncbi:hypothetical protein ACIBCB_26260 [Streptomyces uncialis]
MTNQTSFSYRPVGLSTVTNGAKPTAEVTDIAISGQLENEAIRTSAISRE